MVLLTGFSDPEVKLAVIVPYKARRCPPGMPPAPSTSNRADRGLHPARPTPARQRPYSLL